MKKIKTFCVLITALALFTACASVDNDKKANTEEKTMENEVKEFINNGYAGDCPKDYSEFRLDGVEYGKIDHATYYSNTCKIFI